MRQNVLNCSFCQTGDDLRKGRKNIASMISMGYDSDGLKSG